MGKLADAYVEISAKLDRLQSGLDAAHSMTQAGVNRTSGMMLGLWSAVANQVIQMAQRMAQGIAQGIQDAVMSAGNLAESVSKTGATFGTSASTIIDAADAMAEKFGTSKQVFIDGAVNLGLIAKGAGMAKDEAAKFGVQFAKLADDISSFDDIGIEEGMVALRAGLVGEYEPMRRFGVTLSEAVVQQEAFRLGLGKTKAELDGHDKMIARASLMMQGFTDRIGDHERTQNSMKNALREAQGRWENLRTELGERLVPVVGQLSKGFGAFARSLQDDLHNSGSELNRMGEVWKTVFTDIDAILARSGMNVKSWKDLVILAFKDIGDAAGDLTGAIRSVQIVTAAAAGKKPGAPMKVESGIAYTPLGWAMDVLHDLAQGGREFDRNEVLNKALMAQRARQAEDDRQAKLPFVGPPQPGPLDMARRLADQARQVGQDAVTAAKIENARKALVGALIERPTLGNLGNRLLGGLAGGGGLAGAGFGVLSDAAANNNAPAWVQRMARAGAGGGEGGLLGGLIGMGEGIQPKLRKAFQSTMMNTSDIANEVTKAALSHKDETAKRTMHATEKSEKHLGKLVGGGGLQARFARKGAK